MKLCFTMHKIIIRNRILTIYKYNMYIFIYCINNTVTETIRTVKSLLATVRASERDGEFFVNFCDTNGFFGLTTDCCRRSASAGDAINIPIVAWRSSSPPVVKRHVSEYY